MRMGLELIKVMRGVVSQCTHDTFVFDTTNVLGVSSSSILLLIYSIISQLVDVFVYLISSSSSHLSIKVNVAFQPAALGKHYSSVNLGEFQP